jgi:hypothetical protein
MMNISKARWGIIAAGVVVVIIVVILIVALSHHGGTAATQTSASSSTQNSIANATTTVTNADVAAPAPIPTGKSGGTTGGSSVPILPSPVITINLITPISNNTWTIGQPNPIAWSAPANITGEIELVNATTKAFIGVILSQTGPNQTSYSWDARSIYLARYGADQKDVVPGTYSIVIHFDGNGLGDLVSGPITITN